MHVAGDLWQERGLMTTLDLLAENIEEEAMALRNVETYLEMVDAAAADPRFAEGDCRPTLSLKPSSYTTEPFESGGQAAGAAEAVERICVRAREKGVNLSLDMEGRLWTDFTLDLLTELRAKGHDHIGCVIQTRLHRTSKDLENLPDGMRVRLVIGIYQEPSEVATVNKVEMKDAMLEHAEALLKRGHYVEFGTHDERYVRRFVDEVVPRAGVGTDRFEIQMLYGVPRERLLNSLRERGIKARLYVPFALGWPMAIAYLRRRLDEYPAMMWLVIKNLVSRG